MTRGTIKASQRNALVTIAGLDVAWHTMSGGGRSVTVRDDPMTDDLDVIAGTPTADDILLTTSFSPRQDLEWLREMKLGVGTMKVTVFRQWTDENRRPLGDPETYPDCLVVGYVNPVTSPSAEDVDFTLVLATSGEAL